MTTNNQRQLRGPRSDSPLPPARVTSMSAYSVKRRVSILRKQEIMNHWYNAEICVQITQLESKPWKRRTAGFSQLRRVKSLQLKLVTTGHAVMAILLAEASPTGASDDCGESLEHENIEHENANLE